MEIDELQAGRELDALVAEKVMGWKREGNIWRVGEGTIWYFPEVDKWSPSADISDAWEVVEKLQLQCGYAYEGGRPFAMKGIELVVYAETVSLAICKAALKVVGCSVS